MARKLNKSRVDEIINNCSFESKTINYPGINSDVVVIVTPVLKAGKRVNAIRNGVNLMWDENGDYLPGLKTFAFGYALLECFSNIKTGDVEQMFNLIYNTNIVQDILTSLPNTVVECFNNDFEDAVKVNTLVRAKDSNYRTLFKAATSVANSLFEKIDDIVSPENIAKIQSMIKEIPNIIK